MRNSELPPLWQHQREALAFLDGCPRAMLKMGMGTGKSRVVVEFLKRRFDKGLILIVCPPTVVDVWPLEFEKYGEDLFKVVTLLPGTAGSKRAAQYAACAIRAMTERVVVVLNYEACWRQEMTAVMAKHSPKALVCDEIHKVKSPTGKASKWLGKLQSRCQAVLGLTGTPTPHGYLDLFAQYRVVNPLAFGLSYAMFKAKYSISHPIFKSKVVKYVNIDHLLERIKFCTFAVERNVLNLPNSTHSMRFVTLEPSTYKMYRQMAYQCLVLLEDGPVSADNAAVVSLKLRQITSGFIRNSTTQAVTHLSSEKLGALLEVIDDIEPDEPIVVFCSFTPEVDLICKALEAIGETPLVLSGQRKDLARWQAGEGRILVVQIQAGGVGIDLTRACQNIYFSPTHNCGDYAQSMARTDRPGQTRAVTYTHLIAKNTADSHIHRALQAGADLDAAFIQGLKEVQIGKAETTGSSKIATWV